MDIILGILGIVIFITAVFAAWTAFCLFVKGLLWIADWIF